MSAPQIEPIARTDITEVAAYLARAFHADREEAIAHLSWASELKPPNLGFLIRDAGRIVGVFLATYGDTTEGRSVCHLGGWHVDEDYRTHSLSLFRAMLAQDVDAFTDYTPTETVLPLNRRLGFSDMESRAIHVWNLRFSFRRGIRLISDPVEIAQTLSGRDRRVFADHRKIPGIEQVLLLGRASRCHVIYRHTADRLASVRLVYVSDPVVFRRLSAPMFRHMFFRHHAVFTTTQVRTIGGRLRLARRAPSGPRQYKSMVVPERHLNELYSSLVW